MKGRIASFKKPTDMKMLIRAGLSRPHEPLSATALGINCWCRVSSGLLRAPSGGLAVCGWESFAFWKLPIVGGWNVPH